MIAGLIDLTFSRITFERIKVERIIFSRIEVEKLIYIWKQYFKSLKELFLFT